jgi:hypothetical protein
MAARPVGGHVRERGKAMTDDDLERLHTGILTQHEAAISHLDIAYRLYMAGEYAAAVTLAGAAEEVLGKLIPKIGASQMKSGMELLMASTGWSADDLNKVRNWLKHDRCFDLPRGEVFHAAFAMMIRVLNNAIACDVALAENASSMLIEVWSRFEDVESRLQQRRQGVVT